MKKTEEKKKEVEPQGQALAKRTYILKKGIGLSKKEKSGRFARNNCVISDDIKSK